MSRHGTALDKGMVSMDPIYLELLPLTDNKTKDSKVIVTLKTKSRKEKVTTTLKELPQRLHDTGEALVKVLEFKNTEKDTGLCGECKAELVPGLAYCPFCWCEIEHPLPLPPAEKSFPTNGTWYTAKTCPECGEPIHLHLTYCPFCWSVVG
jgi:hypothetical protein